MENNQDYIKSEIKSDKSEREIYNETTLMNKICDLKPKTQAFQFNHTQIAKGIASLMLLYHHLFRPGNKFVIKD